MFLFNHSLIKLEDSRIINTITQWTNQLDEIVNDFIVTCTCSWICFRTIISLIDWEIDALFNTTVFYSSTITFDAQSKAKTRSFRKTNFSLLEVERIFYFFWFKTHSNTKYLLFVLVSKLIRTRDTCFSRKLFVKRNFLIWFLHRCLNRIEMIWKITIVVIFAFDRLELIETFAKIVADTSDWRLLLNSFFQWFFSIESCLLRFRWYCDQKFFANLHYRVYCVAQIISRRSKRRFSHELIKSNRNDAK